MERSTKFMSLSGLSGVLAGIYALVGAYMAYQVIDGQGQGTAAMSYYDSNPQVWSQLILIASIVLLLSVATMVMLTIRQTRKSGQGFWNPGSRRLLSSLSLPVISGGLFIIILLIKGEYSLVAPACLIFYGMSLVSGSQYTMSDVKWLGICEIVLGLLCALMPEYGLLFWAIGFGLLHILYGSIMHFKYKQ